MDKPKLTLVPIHFKHVKKFIKDFHRHNKPPIGHKFSIGAQYDGKLVGVVVVSRPIGRYSDDGFTAEVTRCCVVDEAPKGTNSFLYGAAWRSAKNMGYTSMITYTLVEESGASLRGAGWVREFMKKGQSFESGWGNRKGRVNQGAVHMKDKYRWRIGKKKEVNEK